MTITTTDYTNIHRPGVMIESNTLKEPCEDCGANPCECEEEEDEDTSEND